MHVTPYLIDVLADLRSRHDDLVWFQLERIRAGIYRITAPCGQAMVVDSKRKMAEDSCLNLLSMDFPGRIQPEHSFSVRWLAPDGEEIEVTVEASSATLAKILIDAPDSAVAVEV